MVDIQVIFCVAFGGILAIALFVFFAARGKVIVPDAEPDSAVDAFLDELWPFGAGRILLEASTVPADSRRLREAEKVGFELVRETDPGFDEHDFRDRMAWMFSKVHHAITDQDLARVRDFTDDRALRSLQDRIDAVARDGHVETFKGLRIENIQLVTAKRDGPENRLVLHVAASAARSIVERATGRLVLPDTNGDGVVRRHFTESWVLTRQADATSTPRPPVHRCPFCGGPVAEDHRYACTYCGTDLRGPELEWTIAMWQIV